MEILEKAGFTVSDIDAIETWDQYVAMGETVLEKTGVPMTCFEVSNQRPFWPMIVQHGGDYLTKDNEVILDSQSNIEVLDYMLDMYNSGIAIQAGGGATSTEEFYTFMNTGSVASLTMPAWYMSRFLNYMPDLKGKIAIRPMPVFKQGEARTVGIGGTGTAITNQCKNIDVAKEFLYEAKLSYEANINIWNKLSFDPVNLDTWADPELMKPSEYFYGESFFETMAPYMSACKSPANADLSVAAQDLVNNTIMYSVFVDQSKTPEEALKSAAEELRAQQ
jgi:arabinosaccharide transport system substrate-binding protein